MANPNGNRPRWPLALVLAYSLAGAGWGLVRTPLSPEEARILFIGREVLAEGAPACPPGAGATPALAEGACAWPGSVVLAPVAAAWADGRGGLRAARLASVLLGLLLVAAVHRSGNAARWGRRGLLAAATFALLGLPLQLCATALPRVMAAALLAASIAFMDRLEEREPGPAARLGLPLLAAACLSLAVLSSYVAAPFAGPLALALAIRHRKSAAGPVLAVALALALAAYVGLAVRPAWPALREALRLARPEGWSVPPGRFGQIFDRLALPYLLATFALFHRDGRRGAAAAMALAGAAFVVPLLSASVDDAQSAVLLSLVLLAPAAGVGVAQMAEIFSSGNPSRLARPFFAAAVLAIVGVFGIQEMKALRREQPDLSPAIAFLRGAGATVLVDSDYGSPDLVYRYFLEAERPPARVVPIARASERERHDALAAARPDYVVLDEHHSDRSFGPAAREYLAQGYSVAAAWPLGMDSGRKTVRVLRRSAR